MKCVTRAVSVTSTQNNVTDNGVMSEAIAHSGVFVSRDAVIDSWTSRDSTVYMSMYSTYSAHTELSAAATAMHGVR